MATSSEEPNAAAASADPDCCSCSCWITAAAAVLLRSLRWTTIVLAATNGLVLVGGALLAALALRRCGLREKATVVLAAAAAGARVGAMVGAGVAQEVTATWILRHPAADASVIRRKRRIIHHIDT
ncbi:hypothetical protein Taro_042613 [Colocasia esculenta]|uniref:DUF7358 domain-containing protein n=1 Tax=Colocasia esculenta TaxID=4460 RepID=A0A843WYX6_COLES|nr:hypothetical protein [Colocasia esculenta]